MGRGSAARPRRRGYLAVVRTSAHVAGGGGVQYALATLQEHVLDSSDASLLKSWYGNNRSRLSDAKFIEKTLEFIEKHLGASGRYGVARRPENISYSVVCRVISV